MGYKRSHSSSGKSYRWFFYLLAGFIISLLILRFIEGNSDPMATEDDFWENKTNDGVHQQVRETSKNEELNEKHNKREN